MSTIAPPYSLIIDFSSRSLVDVRKLPVEGLSADLPRLALTSSVESSVETRVAVGGSTFGKLPDPSFSIIESTGNY